MNSRDIIDPRVRAEHAAFMARTFHQYPDVVRSTRRIIGTIANIDGPAWHVAQALDEAV